MDDRLEKHFLEEIQENRHVIHKICFLYANSREEREDYYQEIVLQLWKSYPSFKGNSSFTTWMYRVGLNTVLSQVKKNREYALRSDSQEMHYDPQQEMDLSEEVRLLYAAISRLNKIDKAIILMWLEEHSYDEIAENLGITTKNVSVKLVRIKENVARIIQNLQ